MCGILDALGSGVLSDPVDKPSKLMLDECFAAGDDRFLDEFVRFHSWNLLLAYIERWVADEREWAREQIIAYLQTDLNHPGHEVVVKRLFKHFEAAADHEMMGWFMVAFDRLVRRRRMKQFHYDWSTRRSWSEQHLRAIPNKTIVSGMREQREAFNPMTGQPISYTHQYPTNSARNQLFTHRTRNYLRRRVWRYFRCLSYSNPAEYVAGISRALCQYRDADFEAGENIIDNWSLMHACYFHHEGVQFGPSHTNLTAGHSLSELSPAPYQPDAWKDEAAVEHLVTMILDANSSLVRIWAMEMLQTEHQAAIGRLDVRTLIRLLSHIDQRVQQFAAELFGEHPGLSSLPIATWLELLDQADPGVLNLICEAMRKHVSAERLDNVQMLELAKARPVPVARMAFEMLQERHRERGFSSGELMQLSGVGCEVLAGEITGWCLQHFSSENTYEPDAVIEFFDSLSKAMRTAAVDWLQSDDCPGRNDPVLWARLIETPFDDVRLRLVEDLERRASISGATADAVSPVWAAVILGVHRGGRTKLKAVCQIRDVVAEDHRRAESLLPVLAVAMRSVREPERRSALSAVATLVDQHVELHDAVRRHIPELIWDGEAVGAEL